MTVNSPLPGGYSLIASDGTAGQARAIDAAATGIGVPLLQIHYSPDRNGYVVPDAVATAYTANPTDPGDPLATAFTIVDNHDGTATVTPR